MDKIEAFILEQVRKKGEYNDMDKSVMELLDSFDYIELVMAIEQNFGIMLDLSKNADLLSVNGIMQQVNSIRNA